MTGVFFVFHLHKKNNSMNPIISFFQKQLHAEAEITRGMLRIVPADKFQWQPHPRSMTLVRLATHVAEVTGWIPIAIDTTELDFETGEYPQPVIENIAQLMAYFEQNVIDADAALVRTDDKKLEEKWTMRGGEVIYAVMSKGEMIRVALSQLIHHRAQLGVFLRLLDIPIPGSYGPSADEMQLSEMTA